MFKYKLNFNSIFVTFSRCVRLELTTTTCWPNKQSTSKSPSCRRARGTAQWL